MLDHAGSVRAARRRHRTVHPDAGRQGDSAVGEEPEDARRTSRASPICRWTNTTWTSTWRAAFPAEICRRWCVLPFDRMSKSILVATANPFNQQAAKELAEATTQPPALVSGAAGRDLSRTSAKPSAKPPCPQSQIIWRTHRRRARRGRPADRQAGGGTARTAEEGRHAPAQARHRKGLRQRAGHGRLHGPRAQHAARSTSPASASRRKSPNCSRATSAHNHKVVPVSRLENKLFLAMADPLNVLAIDDVKRITKLEVIAADRLRKGDHRQAQRH